MVNFNDIVNNVGTMELGKRGDADTLIAMAITHHLLLTQRININDMFLAMKSLTSKYIFVEFMPMGLWDGKNYTPPLPDFYNEEWFRNNMERHFEILLREKMNEKNRILFVGKRIDLQG